MKKKRTKILYSVYEGTAAWDAIIKSPMPNTSRLHELVVLGMAVERGIGAQPGLAVPTPAAGLNGKGQVDGSSNANPQNAGVSSSTSNSTSGDEYSGPPVTPFSTDQFADFDDFGGASTRAS